VRRGWSRGSDAGQFALTGCSSIARSAFAFVGPTTSRSSSRARSLRGYAGSTRGIRRIGVASVDGPEGRDALDAASAMATLGGATLSIYTALEPASSGAVVATPGWVPPLDYEAQRRERAHAAIERTRASAPAAVLEAAETLEGDPAHALAAVSM
jgi:hypothetical protein